MAMQPDETRVTATLPNLDLEMRFSRDPDGRAETVTLSLRAAPGFEAAAGLLAGPALPLALMGAANPWANPFALWAGFARLAWQPWIDAMRALPGPGGGDRR
jgi:hypothetical protein